MLRLLIKNTQAWIDAPHKRATSKQTFGNAYNLIFHNLFCKSYEQYEFLISGGLFPETAIDAKAFLEDYFKIDLTI